MQTSSRRAIQFPSLDRSDRPDVPAHIKYLVDALELDPSLAMGSSAARPANPGYPRYFYWATDTKVLTFWDGSSWTGVGSADVIAQTVADAKGDLIVGLTDNVVGRLGVGANGTELLADNTAPQGVKWALNAALDLIAAKGDLLVGTSVDTLARIAVGTNGQAVVADSAQATGVRWGVPAPTTIFQEVTSNVPLTSTGGQVNINELGLSLAPGAWLVTCIICVTRAGQPATTNLRLWDGVSTTWGGGFGDTSGVSSGKNVQIHAQCRVPNTGVLGSTTSLVVTATPDNTTQVVTAASTYATGSAGNHASSIMAIQVA